MLQTEPQIQEVLGIDEKGHDYFLQITDARPDTGGLSGATPAEAVSWGKVDPDQLPDTVVCYTGQHDRPAAAHRLRAGPARPAAAPAALRPARGDDGAAGRGVPGRARVPRTERADESLAHMHPGAGGTETDRAPVTDHHAPHPRRRTPSACSRSSTSSTTSTATSSSRCSSRSSATSTSPTPSSAGWAPPTSWSFRSQRCRSAS